MSLWSRLRDAIEVWRLGDPEDNKGPDWRSAVVLIIGMAVFGLVANSLVWASIEGFGR